MNTSKINGFALAIDEAKKMLSEKISYRESICTTEEEEANMICEEEVIKELIERLEEKAKQPLPPNN